MNYKKELKRMIKDRKKYFTVIDKLFTYYCAKTEKSHHAEIDSVQDVAVILELIDVGYVKDTSFKIEKSFGEIHRLLYTGDFPLTGKGEIEYRQYLQKKKKKVYGICIVLVILIASLLFLFTSI